MIPFFAIGAEKNNSPLPTRLKGGAMGRELFFTSLAALGTYTGFYPKRDVKNLLNKIYEYALIEDYCNKVHTA